MSDLRRRLICSAASFLGWAMVRIIGHTAYSKVLGFENVLKLRESGQGFILSAWHGRTLLPIHYCRGMGIWAITSLSRDGEIQTRLVERFGYRTIRGSTGRGGMKAALMAAKRLAEGDILSITPDGPKGPPNEVQGGIVFLAQRAKCPIIPVGAAANPCVKTKAWDSYMLPLPFSEAAIIFGEPIYLTGTAAPEELIKRALDDLQRQAEELVGEGS